MLNKRFSTMTKTLACFAPLGLALLGMNAHAAPPQASETLAQQAGGCEQPASQNLGQGQGGPGYGQGPWRSRGGLGPGGGRGGPGEGRGSRHRQNMPPPSYGPGTPGRGYGQGYPGYGMGQYPAPVPYGPAQPYRPRPW